MRRAILPLVAALAAFGATSCNDETPFESGPWAEAPNASGLVSVNQDGIVVFRDDPTWDDWTFTRPEQTGIDGGTKNITFEPQSNFGVSPEFDPVTETHVSFDIYIPMRFPVFGLPFSATTTILALLSSDPTAGAHVDVHNKISLNLSEGRTWRVHSVGIDNENSRTFSSRDQFLAPWLFEHGWNHVNWTIRMSPRDGRDAMRLQVGDRIYAWNDVELAPMHQPIRHVAVGPWEAGIGDQHFGIRNLTVQNLDVTPTTPPPTTHAGLAGGRVLTGFWDGWLARHPMGPKYGEQDNFGTMGNNTVAATKMNLGRQGWLECDIFYDTEIHPGEGGGQHLIGPTSQSASRSGPYDPELDHQNLGGWLRLDLGVRENALQGVIYQDSPDRKTFVTGSYPFHAYQEWAHLRVEWEQFDASIRISVNGKSSTHAIEPGRNPIGNMLMIGNMDRNTGSRCRNIDPCGMLGKIRYRNFRWGSDL